MECFDKFVENWLDTSRYGHRYRADPDLLDGKRPDLLKLWIDELMDAATKEAFSDDVIESYIEIFSETRLLQTFRGKHGKGLQNYTPKDKKMAHQQNPMMF